MGAWKYKATFPVCADDGCMNRWLQEVQETQGVDYEQIFRTTRHGYMCR